MDSFDRVLILETSGKVGHVAVASGRTILGRRELPEARRHARDLTERCRELLAERNWHPRDLSGVIVCTGPGSYTGLRVGIVSAKTLAYASGCDLFGVPTFAAIAAQIEERPPALEIIADALQDKVYAQRFIRDERGAWRPDGRVSIRPFDEWARELHSDALIAGPALNKYGNRIPEATRVVAAQSWEATADGLLRHAMDNGDDVRANVWEVEPMYLRGSSAEEKRRNG